MPLNYRMQKYISLFFSVLLFLTACNNEKPPKDVLDQKAMISLLTDVHLTDGTIYTVPQVPDSMYKYAHAKFVEVFKKHHTTDAVFKNSLKYYSKRPEQIQEIYTQVEASIKAKIDSVNKPAAPAPGAVKPAVSQPNAGHPPVAAPVNAAVPARPHLPGVLHKLNTQKNNNALPPK
jgi:hypothetical protein